MQIFVVASIPKILECDFSDLISRRSYPKKFQLTELNTAETVKSIA